MCDMIVCGFSKFEIKTISDVMQILNKYFRSGIICQLLKYLRYVILMGFTENC